MSGTTHGYELGIILGKAQGELLKAKEIAVKLLATWLSKSEVAEIFGLDESELDIA